MSTPEQKPTHGERPWSEAQWAAFMREGEARAARMSEILETVIDRPDRWEIVAREMGWELVEDGSDDPAEMDTEFIVEEASPEQTEAMTLNMEKQDREVEAIPAYARAMALSGKMDNLLEPLLKEPSTLAEEIVEVASDAYIQVKIIGAKISSGHAMGYEDEVLCGNIVCNTVAREAAGRCRQALVDLQERQFVPKEKISELLIELEQVEQALDQRIADLRGRVWW